MVSTWRRSRPAAMRQYLSCPHLLLVPPSALERSISPAFFPPMRPFFGPIWDLIFLRPPSLSRPSRKSVCILVCSIGSFDHCEKSGSARFFVAFVLITRACGTFVQLCTRCPRSSDRVWLTWFWEFPGRWAATVATYCPSRLLEHSKSKSTKPRSETFWVTLYTTTK